MTSKNQTNPYIYGIGRKKESTAIVYLVPFTDSNSQVTCEVNGHKAEQYFQQNFTYLNQISLPLKKVKLDKKYKIIANVKGGGLTGQADSIRLGISRALCKVDKINFRPILKFEGFLKRDARIKERRKYGLKKARKASQYSKR
uniref:Ribosomal protein S9 n=1 Tax=Macrocystis pyrifera TaxID=35122 RepID=A0A8F0F8J0_MACPY|nr:30S ribosomal protein S9 [Macrocystis integrifolia]YP_010445061.1 ribosomal protein S9 [Macrocystis pyrifera]WKF19414.1 ribosomal protein S9 [Macrocystis sp.]QVE47611.1 30S ribosomal protein S9 [Macrocystis integrifolia]QWK42454.1 ribosomal protein S9 [Macrocystis pyrifera]UTJ90562.1 ribosomal protein S9 [Macrocystis pyrifera]